MSGSSGVGAGIDRVVLVARDDEPAGVQIDRRQPVVRVVHVLVVLVAQSEIEREVASGPPVVLGVEVKPIAAAVLVAAADARGSRGRVSEQEVGERVAAELPRVTEGAARVVGLHRPAAAGDSSTRRTSAGARPDRW